MDWTRGYVADIGYTAGFYRETAPSHMAFAALLMGRSPGRAYRPKRVLELGFGQGFGLSLLAAANPDIAFEGYDFNPEHVAHARRLIQDAELQNVTVTETSFEEAAARGGDNDLDVIAVHGILSWVDAVAGDAIVAIARQRLQPDGMMYVSYNCMPGWAPLAPIRQFMLQVKHRHAGRSERQLGLALDLITKLKAGNAHYFLANPSAAQHLEQMLKLDRVYLAHEYLDEHWKLFQFSDMVTMLGAAKLAFLASATLPENLDQYAVPAALSELVAQTDDPILKETIRDYASNKRFRRDLFARGSASLTSTEHRRLLTELKFALVMPRDQVSLQFGGPLTMLTGVPELYAPLLDLLASKNASFDELMEVFPRSGKPGILLDCLGLLVHSGQVLPIVGGEAADAGPAQRFNRAVVKSLKAGRIYNALASPVTRTGIGVGEVELLALAAVFDNQAEDVETAARYALSLLVGMGKRPINDGKLVDDDGEALKLLEERLRVPLQDRVPIWRRLGVL
ncbi:MAG: hypothetical protein QOJ96_582 [Alphaproteobacteria bacterium]|jgi:predicted O-methyltransferase YrrM|nr:hypothetical protein [Alphaproteobacteria bacterium]